MKRLLCVLMAGALLFAFGAPVAATGLTADDIRPVLTNISECVAESQEIIVGVQEIIDWQLVGSAAELEAYREALQNGWDYESPDDYDEVVAKADELDGAINRVVSLRARVDAYSPTGLKSVDATIAAAKAYFSWLEGALRDLMSIFDFYFEQDEALELLDAYDVDQYEDFSDVIAALYYGISDATDALAQVNCPAFMQECFDKYIRTTRKYLAVLETMYTAVQLEDVLRNEAAFYLIGRMEIEVGLCEIELTELFNLQYEKVRARLDGDIGTLRQELSANCATLLFAL